MALNPYQSPNTTSSPEQPPTKSRRDFAVEYDRPLLVGLVVQIALLLVTLLVFGPGERLRDFGIAFAVQWATVLNIVFRRPMAPTRFDLIFVRIGIAATFLIVSGVRWLAR